ncbi:MAG: nucleotidyltransferase family protein [Myxococcales bacterium]|nr:nucleotidyltransferase family protein [Myxococcales bacterium]
MGFPKVLLPYDGDNIAISPLKFLWALRIKTFLTLPDFLLHNKQFCDYLSMFDILIRANRYPNLGFSGSIKTVLAENKKTQGLLIFPIDAPFFSRSLLNAFITTIDFNWPIIAVPHFYQAAGHPVYFSEHFFKALIHADSIGGPHAVIRRNKKYVRRILWPDSRILWNLNYQKDINSSIKAQVYYL